MQVSQNSSLLGRISTIADRVSPGGVLAGSLYSMTTAVVLTYAAQGNPAFMPATVLISSFNGMLAADIATSVIENISDSLSKDWSNVKKDIDDDLEAGKIKEE